VAAGASMVHPSVAAILVTPVCPHSLSFRPIILPAGVELKVGFFSFTLVASANLHGFLHARGLWKIRRVDFFCVSRDHMWLFLFFFSLDCGEFREQGLCMDFL